MLIKKCSQKCLVLNKLELQFDHIKDLHGSVVKITRIDILLQ